VLFVAGNSYQQGQVGGGMPRQSQQVKMQGQIQERGGFMIFPVDPSPHNKETTRFTAHIHVCTVAIKVFSEI
jgi:hypothetical protein